MLPEGWNETYLGEVIAHKKGFAFNSGSYRDKGVRIVRISDTTRNSIHSENPVYLAEEDAYGLESYKLSQDDIILSTVGSRPHLLDSMVGKAVKVPPEADGSLLNQNLVKVIPKLSEITNEYLYEMLKNKRFIFFISTLVRGNANQVSITLADLFKYQFVLPPLPEQKKIAQILSTWDKAITTTEQRLTNSQQQKKALMQQLLTGKQRLLDQNGERFEGEWREFTLSAICQINPKKPASPVDGKVSFVAMEAVSEEAKLLSSVVRDYVDVSKGFTSFADNDVLVAKITPCFENGKGAYVEGMQNGIGFGSTEFHVLRAGAKSDSKYLYYLTNTSEFRVRGEANMQGSAGQKRVTTDYLKSLKVTVPIDVAEQQKIAAVLTAADQEITTLQQQLDHLKQEKKALMQQLLTGKRRVKVEPA